MHFNDSANWEVSSFLCQAVQTSQMGLESCKPNPSLFDVLLIAFFFSFFLCASREVNIIDSFQKEKTISSVLKAVTRRLSLCCAVKGKACIQNCGEVDNNVDQHNKSYSAERKKKTAPKTWRPNICW